MTAELPHRKTLDSRLADFLLKDCPDHVVVLNPAWLMVFANPTFCSRILNRPAWEGGEFLSTLDGPSNERMETAKEQLLQGPRQMDLTHISPGGKLMSLQYCFFPIASADHDERLLAGIGRDRTADLASLLEIVQLNIELEHKSKALTEANVRLEQLAVTDQITKIYNRHYFFQVSQHFWEEARRYHMPLTTMMMDIDNFKAVNDTYGHLFGDHVLRQVAERLKNNTRKSDILARYGGEELIVLASNTDIQTALVLAERLRVAVAAEPFSMGSAVARVTVSVGVSGTDLDEFASFEALLDSSDLALYGAKRAGRNSVCTYSRSISR